MGFCYIALLILEVKYQLFRFRMAIWRQRFAALKILVVFFRKHLGLARLVFEEVKSAKECVKHLHGRSVMGQVVRNV